MNEEKRKEEEEDGLKINDDVVINKMLYFITTFSLC
jgi:hypothetical protein